MSETTPKSAELTAAERLKDAATRLTVFRVHKDTAQVAGDISLLADYVLATVAADEGGVKTSCPECEGTRLSWQASPRNSSGVPDGRLRAHEVGCDFILGCDECSATVMVMDANEVAALMTADMQALQPSERETQS